MLRITLFSRLANMNAIVKKKSRAVASTTKWNNGRIMVFSISFALIPRQNKFSNKSLNFKTIT